MRINIEGQALDEVIDNASLLGSIKSFFVGVFNNFGAHQDCLKLYQRIHS